MHYLFGKSSLSILESLSFTKTLYAFDFDGTLAPIVKEPDEAKMGENTALLFGKLSANVPTAVISGRSLADLRERLPATTRFLVGNHGMEGLPKSTPVQSLRGQVRKWRYSLYRRLGEVASDLGIHIEDKGHSLAVHYRKSRKKKIARTRILEALENLDGNPRIIHGKLVYNLLPVGAPHKGDALIRLMPLTGTSFALYVGDDDTDEDVFTLKDHRILTVRVGERRASQAKYFVRKQGEIDSLLSHLLRFHGIERAT